MDGKRFWIGLSVFAACAGSGASAKKFADGLVFEVELLEEGEKKLGRDRLTIDSGFESEKGRAHGFSKGTIEVHGARGNFAFTAYLRTPLGGEQQTWRGKVEGDWITGFYIWKRPDNALVKVTFEGKLVLPAKPAAPAIAPPQGPTTPPPAVPTPSTARPPSPR